MNTETQKQGLDWIGIVATPTLGVIACFALYFGYDTVAAAVVGAIGGYYMRLYR